jgi:PPK2 family polyphosphate:nucleotide phosphotransferase
VKNHQLDHTPFLVRPGRKVKLKEYPPDYTAGFAGKREAKSALSEDVSALAAAQERLWASADRAVLIIFQALDAAGKDGAIKHVMSGVNPQGCDVYSFKAPSAEELRHHFLWRPVRYLPGRGRIAIFNRSYYEEVLVVRVHPAFLEPQWLARDDWRTSPRKLWNTRYQEINDFEKLLSDNGTCIIKFFLNVSKKEQKQRFLERLDNPEKHWKFSAADVRERGHWDDYQKAYEDMLSATSSSWAPWYIVPADKKWFTRACIADIVTTRIDELNLEFPTVSEDEKEGLSQARKQLLNEED